MIKFNYTVASYSIDQQVRISGEVLRSYEHFVCELVKELGSDTFNILHAAVGISGEAGELLDAVKKHWAYSKPLDVDNVIEELGDLEFYMAAMRQLVGVSRHHVLQINADKLAVRYAGLTYSDASAIARADKIVETQPITAAEVLAGKSQAITL